MSVVSATLIGNYNITSVATGQCGAPTTATLTINVVCPTITFNPTTLPNGTVNTAYAQTITASPAGGNYSYAVTSGALPAGVTLNNATGALTGTPTANGTFNFTITATSGGCSGSQSYTLTIICPVITLTPATLPGVQAGVAYTQVFSVPAQCLGDCVVKIWSLNCFSFAAPQERRESP